MLEISTRQSVASLRSAASHLSLSRKAKAPDKPAGVEMEPMPERGERRESIASEGSRGSAQAGVKRLEAVSTTWSKWSLYLAYLG